MSKHVQQMYFGITSSEAETPICRAMYSTASFSLHTLFYQLMTIIEIQ